MKKQTPKTVRLLKKLLTGITIWMLSTRSTAGDSSRQGDGTLQFA